SRASREVDGQGGNAAHGNDQLDPRGKSFLHDLERAATGNDETGLGGADAIHRREANHLVDRIVTTDVLSGAQHTSLSRAEGGGMKSAGFVEPRLEPAQAARKLLQNAAGEDRAFGERRSHAQGAFDGALAAHATAAGGVKASSE